MKKSLIDFFVLLLQQVHFYYNDAQKNFIIMLFTLQIEQACVSSKFKKKLQKKNVDNNHLVTKKRMIEIGYWISFSCKHQNGYSNNQRFFPSLHVFSLYMFVCFSSTHVSLY